MSEVVTPEGQAPVEPVVDPEAPVVEGDGNDPEAVESPLWEGIDEDHPVRNEVKKLRDEAAQRRTTAQQVKAENEELKTQLAEAKTAEEVQALVAAHESRVAELEGSLLRTQIATSYKLPEELAELLKGDDEASLKAHAERLAKFVPKGQTPPATEPRGGRTPSQPSTDIDSTIAAIKSNRR